MEEIISFEENVIFPTVKYSANFDPLSGVVLAVGPSSAFFNQDNIIDVETELAEMIMEGKINIVNCMVDVRSMTLELLEKKTVSAIDDVLHKIIEEKWSEIDNPDIFLTYSKRKNQFTVELTEEFRGTKKMPKKYQPVSKRKIIWAGETVLNFYVTEYNDPHVLYAHFSVTLKDLVGKKFTVENLFVPEKFSVYTRRLLKNYTIKLK